MTILVRDDINTNRILVTVTEIDAVTSGNTLNLFDSYANVSSSYPLPADSSPYPGRYNEFLLPTSTFSGLSEGVYEFTINDADGNETESGLLKVVTSVKTVQEQVEDQYIYIKPANTDDDFIVYRG